MYKVTNELRVKDGNEKPVESYERGLAMDILTILT